MTKRLCGNCGSQLFGKGSRGDGMIHIKVGTIDNATFVRPVMPKTSSPIWICRDFLHRPSFSATGSRAAGFRLTRAQLFPSTASRNTH
jgi:hypothetical protein